MTPRVYCLSVTVLAADGGCFPLRFVLLALAIVGVYCFVYVVRLAALLTLFTVTVVLKSWLIG